MAEERLRSALARIYPFLSFEETRHGEQTVDLIPLRVTTRCNEECPFCQAALPESGPIGPEPEQILAAARRVARLVPPAKLVITGGEPTLRKDIVDIVDALLALDHFLCIEIQTNGTVIGANPDRFPFTPSEQLQFLVGLHAVDEARYDACTNTKNQLSRALRGVKHLMGAGHKVELNTVVTSLNVDHIAEMPGALATEFATGPAPALHLSIMGIPEQRAAAELLVRYSDLLPAVAAALGAAAKHGVTATVALSAGHAAVPVCMLDADARTDSELAWMYQHEASEADRERWWAQGPECGECLMNGRCLGLPGAYAERFGFDELRPLTPDEDREP